MVSNDFSGAPILIFGIAEVRILEKWMKGLDTESNSNENRVMEKISRFLNDPECLEWERQSDA